MKLKTPPFWYRDEGSEPPLLEKFMTPGACLYRLGYTIHQNTTQAQNTGVPIVCIGNLNAGGTGKTPTALALLKTIRENGLAGKPFFLSRGYGGGEPGPLIVDPQKHDAWDTGDEALILAMAAPTIVAADRLEGATLAQHKGADLVIMDDGLQNPGIHKDIKILVINGEMGFGNRKMIPAGPLRAPLQKGLEKVDAFILIGEDKRNVRRLLPPEKPLFTATLKSEAHNFMPQGERYLAFAGLGYPDKFFNFLKNDLQLDVTETVTFADHYPYGEQDLQNLHRKAQDIGAVLLTTQKDYMRLPKIQGIEVRVLPVHLAWDDENALAAFLKARLS